MFRKSLLCQAFLALAFINILADVVPPTVALWGASTANNFDPLNPAASGYKLVLDEEFNYSNTRFIDFTGEDTSKLWHSGLWYQRDAIPPASLYSVSDSILTIQDSGMVGIGTNLCTTTAQYPTQSGKSFKGGYIELRLLTHNWGGAGLYSVAWAQRDMAAIALHNGGAELDILETDESHPNVAVTSEHSDSLGAKYGYGADKFNRNNVNVIANPPMEGKWHTAGVLWTQSDVTWYVDGRIVSHAPAWPQLWQPMMLCLWASPGGVMGGQTVKPAEVRYDWVHVWQLPGSAK
jgi:Glycosyl hydrolases family 16